MILDTLDALPHYVALHPGIEQVARWLSERDILALPEGPEDLRDGIHVNVFTHETKPFEEATGEAHRAHIDIHVVIDGAEWIGVLPLWAVDAGDYVEATDFIPTDAAPETAELRPGLFAVIFPHEAHTTGLHPEGARENVKKMVFKLPVS